MSKRSAHGTHVWVRTDLIEAVLHHQGNLPAGWKPASTTSRRHGSTNITDWGWARAQVSGATSPLPSPDRGSNGERTPFGSVKLRKTQQQQQQQQEDDSDAPKLVTASFMLDDEEFAPQHLLYAPVSITYDAKDSSLVCMANSWWHSEGEEPPEDLTNLSHLHEPAVVFCLQRRYEQDAIYTYTGKVLLALNPFRPVNNVYGEHVMHQYWNMVLGHRPPPHVYAIAEDAYRSLVRSLLDHYAEPHIFRSGQDQSILVSGESGAGKTVTTKIVMQYLATLSQNSDRDRDNSIEAQVLQSNPILESFGNARTVRNDNSSRFGKFIEIEFNSAGSLVSASITTYLLEKVRLITQTPGERNYHIFYEILSGVTQRERQQLRMGNLSAYDFNMTAASGTFDRRDGVADRDTFRALREALDTVGFTQEEQFEMFRVCAALLHASNLGFQEHNDASELDLINPSLRHAVDLFGVSAIGLNEACCRFAIEARGETLYKNLSILQAQKAMEALIKATYEALFTHIARRINSFITVRDESSVSSGRNRGNDAATASIGVLDIFGFESFEENSFEQLCINFCNEALQQQFNKFVFKQEQDEYKREGIEWSFIAFPDNQDVLDLIEKKRDGIISILDEQCRLQRCTDSSFARALYDKCSDHARFSASKSQQVNLTFCIRHYAGEVEYSAVNFLEKNKDELPKETTELLLYSSNKFVTKLAQILAESTGTKSDKTNVQQKRSIPRSASKRDNSSSLLRESVGSQFSTQLRDLRSRVADTEPHYVRCLKPNDDLIPYNFQPLVIADQLRCAGVLEAIRVSRVGFPHRYSHQDFVTLYSVLCRTELEKYQHQCDARQLCEILCTALIPPIKNLIRNHENEGHKAVVERDTETSPTSARFLGLQMGRSKVFIRPKTFEALDLLRGQKVEKAAITIQAAARMFLGTIRYEICQIATIIMQAAVRRFCAVRRAWRIRLFRRATTIQTAWRTYSARRRFFAALIICGFCQSAYRGAAARSQCHRFLLGRRAATIQRCWRRSRHYPGKLSFYALRGAALTLQTAHRRKAAERVLKLLKAEAKDLSCIAKERDKFREETRRLRLELERAKREAEDKGRMSKEVEVKQLKMEVKQLRAELERAKNLPISPTLSHADELGVLAKECELKELQLKGLRRDLYKNNSQFGMSPASKDAIGSIGISFSNDGSLQENVEPPRQQSTKSLRSPGRSSTASFSLLDEDNPEECYPDKSFEEMSNPQDEVGSKSNTTSTVSLSYSQNTPFLRGEAFFRELRRLHDAIHGSDLSSLDEILRSSDEEPHVLINEGDEIGRTALHVAVMSSNLLMTQTLLDKAAIANAQDNDGETPLHLAESASMTSLLVKNGRANPNIPNVDGICSLHLAVQRRDLDSVRSLLLHNANVNSADNVRWFTPLHLIALPPRAGVNDDGDIRCRIAELMAGGASSRYEPDLNYQDSEGNCPLHYAVQLVTPDSYDLAKVFLESGADPQVMNNRKQTALHLICHNTGLRHFKFYPSLMKMILGHGADPNQQSAAGCTALHLSLYHRDIDTAVELVTNGAQLHPLWKKPKRWVSFWDDKGSSGVLALDMVKKDSQCSRILAAISVPQKWAPSRSWCMQCKCNLGTFARALHCRHCGRFICGDCTSSGTLGPEYFPVSFETADISPLYVCTLCEKILMARKASGNKTVKLPEDSNSQVASSVHSSLIMDDRNSGLMEF
ncbi:Unconventional myosin [Seminavis robusta]|uniref:Unconventional myosin n=1 Tax=Seminavis robusta TaxID=568900 RepID=A0A9N8ECV6_9STRA|nr:Unconventional myosin [Seminavis robusta]|eukprot:Sro767_g199470.1 Unconventional myosin (1710) ;mRNA; r:21293-26691